MDLGLKNKVALVAGGSMGLGKAVAMMLSKEGAKVAIGSLDDAYLPDSQAANSEILFAIGVDPCLVGSGLPGGNLGAGSGSDKREAFWQLNAEMGIYRQISLEPMYFIRDFNKWSPDIEFDYVTVDTSQTMQDHPTKIDKRIDKNIA